MNLGEALNVASHAIENANIAQAGWRAGGHELERRVQARQPGEPGTDHPQPAQPLRGSGPARRQPPRGRGRRRQRAGRRLRVPDQQVRRRRRARRAASSIRRGRWFASSSSCCSRARGCVSATPRPAPAGCSSTRPSTCGSAEEDIRNLALHGQERNLGTLAIGKLNLLLHGLRAARLEAGDVIAEPQLTDPSGRLLSYDRVIANPPVQPQELGARLRSQRPAPPVRPLRRHPAEDEGGPRLPAAHARGDQCPRHGGRGDAPRRPLPGRRGRG